MSSDSCSLSKKIFFDDQLLYRVIPGFLVQFGVAAKPEVMKKWDNKRFPDEPKKQQFKHGTVSFAGAGEDSRSCHLFIAFKPHGETLGQAPHESPIGEVVAGLKVLDNIQENYGKAGYQDLSFLQSGISASGNIAAKDYPKLDRIKTCRKVESSATDAKRAQEDAEKSSSTPPSLLQRSKPTIPPAPSPTPAPTPPSTTTRQAGAVANDASRLHLEAFLAMMVFPYFG